MLNFERIFRHDCRILATKILVSDFYPLYGEASTQVSMTCTRLRMFPSLLGKSFVTSGTSQHVAMFFPIFRKNPKNSRRTFLISVPTSGYA